MKKKKVSIFNKIVELKSLLTATDYKSIKFSEGELTEEEFAPVREQRRAWREEIREHERTLLDLEERK